MLNTMNKMIGNKGSDVYASTGDARLDLSVKLVRGANAAEIESGTLAAAKLSIKDTVVMAFHTRAIRGGKGERDLFRHMLLALNKEYPDLVLRLLELIPHYGCWRDMFDLAANSANSGDADLTKATLAYAVKVLQTDQATPMTDATGKVVSISLAAKWAPREGARSKIGANANAKALATLLFPGDMPHSSRMKAYRKLLSGLNARLNTVETLMSAGRWDEISPPSVPGRAGKIYTRAFLNLVPAKNVKAALIRGDDACLRHPEDEKRMACRETFQAHYARASLGKATVRGADTLFPHEVVKAVYKALLAERGRVTGEPPLTDGEKDHLRAVWRSMVEKEKVRLGGGLKRSIFMSDFSGSMQSSSQSDTPYWVSMAIGLLGAEVVIGEGFRNRFMTFDSDPLWHDLSPAGDIFERVATILHSSIGQGLSTDFQKAMDLVLSTLKAQRIRPGEEPENLIVLTDMNWDAASAYRGNSYRHHVKHQPWETHVEMIRESFKRAGEDMWGSVADGGLGGWAMPRIVIWNLAASEMPRGNGHSANGQNLAASQRQLDTVYSPAGQTDFHATADTPGVAMMSGWSPTQFRVLCEAGPRQLTAMEVLRIELDDPRYDAVRDTVAEWKPYVSHANGFGSDSDFNSGGPPGWW